MTTSQKFKFYFPAWNAAVRANGWHVIHKQVIVDETRLSAEGLKVLAFARQRAQSRVAREQISAFQLSQFQHLSLDDLRHGAHMLAIKRDKSSKDITNAEMDRIVCLFNVLAEPEFLGTKHKMGRLDWDAYERGEDPGAMRRLHWVIESVPEAIARHIAADMIHRRDWEFANIADKRTLARRIAQYKKSKQQPISQGNVRQGNGEKAVVAHSPDNHSPDNSDPDWSVE